MHPITQVEILKTGSFTSAAGTHEYTLADLEGIASLYNSELHEAPIIWTHNSDKNWDRHLNSKQQLANGWVTKLYVQDGILMADIKVDDATYEALKTGQLKKRSVGLYLPDAANSPAPGGIYLRHVALLGAEPPAVKGLKDIIIYSDMDEEILEPMQEAPEQTEEELLDAKAADWLAYALKDEGNGFGGEIAGFEPMPSQENNWLYDVESNSYAGQFYDTDDTYFKFTIAQEDEEWVTEIGLANPEAEEELSEAEEMAMDNASMSPDEEADKKDAQIKMLQDKLAQYESRNADLTKESVTEFCDSLYESGRLTTAQFAKETLYQLVYALEMAANSISYSDDNIPVVKGIKSLLQNLPSQVTFSEAKVARNATPTFNSPYKNGTPESNMMYSEIKAFMQANNITNFADGYNQYKQSHN